LPDAWSIWFYRAVLALACAASVVLFASNAPGIGLLVILCGGGVVVLGAFAKTYRDHGARGVVGVTLAGLPDFFADFISF
jgi:hypothetical protein